MDDATLIEKARDVLDQQGRCQGKLADKDGCVCAEGAVAVAMGEKIPNLVDCLFLTGPLAHDQQYRDAMDHLDWAANQVADRWGIVALNDSQEADGDDFMLAVFGLAAQHAREQGR